MKKEKPEKPKDLVYLDANVFSFYLDIRPEFRFMRDSTRQWWSERRKDFYVCTSTGVERELQQGDYFHQPETLDLVKKVAVLPGNQQIDEIAKYYVEHYLAPKEKIEDFKGDAIHLAICAFYKVDYLLTWDLKHLANVNKFRQLRIMNARMRLTTPEIITPAQLL